MIEVLTFLPYYLPGYTSGGPIRTIANLVTQLGDDLSFKIITSHADPRDPRPYEKVHINTFQKVGKAQVYYASPANLSLNSLRRLICETSHDVLYLNSFFAPVFTIKPLVLRRLGLIPKTPVIVAPRGEFSLGALALNMYKKRLYIATAKTLGLYTDVLWQASSRYEEADLERWFRNQSQVRVAPNLPEVVSIAGPEPTHHEKRSNHLKILFLSRIARKKNLDGALRILEEMEGKITFDIYGPLEDKAYWTECKRLIERLPQNIEACYKGAVPHHQVRSVMATYDLFLFPTHGENYGHVILEALSAGCLVLLSDQTPWRNLDQKGVGWDVPLADIRRYHSILGQCVAMDAPEYAKRVRAAQAFAAEVMHDSKVVEQNLELFSYAAGQQTPLMTDQI